MNKHKCIAIVLLKLSSRRLPNENFLALGSKPLAWYIFESLLEVPEIEEEFCYCSEPSIMNLLPSSTKLLARPSYLNDDDIKANELFGYAVEKVKTVLIVLCQATGPFVSPNSIKLGLKAVIQEEFDCAIGVRRIQTYCWFNGSPINYNPADMEQTQVLSPILEETSGLYIFRRRDYIEHKTRIIGKPYFVELPHREAVDIDTPEDFLLAECLLNYKKSHISKLRSNSQFFVQSTSRNKTFEHSLKHIAFDVDGVLVDSLSGMESAWNTTMRNANLDVDFNLFKKYLGHELREIFSFLEIPERLWDEVQAIYNQESLRTLNQSELFAGVTKGLHLLLDRGFILSIVTSKNREKTDLIVEKTGVKNLFSSIITSDSVPSGNGKPHAYPLLMACLEAKVNPSETLFVGDMNSDRLCAGNASTHFACASWGYGTPKIESSEIWFNSFTDLVNYLIY